MSWRQLRVGLDLFYQGSLIFLTQFADLLPIDWMYEEVSGFIKLGLLIVAIAVFLRFSCRVGNICRDDLFGVLWILLFRSIDNEDIVITRGLIEKKRATVPLNRVQSVRIVENPFRQLFGYANVVIDNAGGGLGEGAKINLFPLVKKTDINGPLKEIFPDLSLEEPTNKLPARGKRYYYRIDFLWMVPSSGCIGLLFLPIRFICLCSSCR